VEFFIKNRVKEGRRMAKGPIVTAAIQFLIVSIHQNHPKWNAKEIRGETSAVLHSKNPNLPPGFPSLSKVQKVLAGFHRDGIKSHDGSEEEPWSLGKSVECKFPPEATMDLLEVAFHGLAAGRELTMRQAKWVCYLRCTKWFTDYEVVIKTGILYENAVVYANWEQISEAMNNDVNKKKLNTFDLDIVMWLPESIANVAEKTGVIDRQRYINFASNRLENGIKFPHAIYPEAGNMVLSDLGFTMQEIDEEISLESYTFEYLKESGKFEARKLADYIHAYWLRYIAKGPKWRTLSHQEQKAIFIKLKTEIDELFCNLNQDFIDGEWEPTEILKAVGYDINDNSSTDLQENDIKSEEGSTK
jgi:hypothetical protein